MSIIKIDEIGLRSIKGLLVNEVLVMVEIQQDALKVPKKYRIDLLSIKREIKEKLKNKRLIENVK